MGGLRGGGGGGGGRAGGFQDSGSCVVFHRAASQSVSSLSVCWPVGLRAAPASTPLLLSSGECASPARLRGSLFVFLCGLHCFVFCLVFSRATRRTDRFIVPERGEHPGRSGGMFAAAPRLPCVSSRRTLWPFWVDLGAFCILQAAAVTSSITQRVLAQREAGERPQSLLSPHPAPLFHRAVELVCVCVLGFSAPVGMFFSSLRGLMLLLGFFLSGGGDDVQAWSALTSATAKITTK